MIMNKNTLKRFWSKVHKTNNCWIWTGSKRNKGYGAFMWTGEDGEIIQGRAHRFSYEIMFGKIPKGLCVLHKCDNPACVNPNHLFLGTKADNNNDMRIKGRAVSGSHKTPVDLCHYKKGKDHHAYKYPDELITNIRRCRISGESFGSLSRRLGISISYIFRICNGTARRNV